MDVTKDNSQSVLLEKEGFMWLANTEGDNVEIVRKLNNSADWAYCKSSNLLVSVSNGVLFVEELNTGLVRERKIKKVNYYSLTRDVVVTWFLNYKYRKLFKKELTERVVKLNSEGEEFYSDQDEFVIDLVRFDIKRERDKDDYKYNVGLWAKSYVQCHSLIIFQDRYIFIGSHGNNLFYIYDFELDVVIRPNLGSLKLSSKKTSDGFIFLKDQVIVVDNLITPKYLLLFDWKVNGAPTFNTSFQIPAHGPYEVVTGYSQSNLLCGLITQSGGRGGRGYHITIFDVFNLERYFSISIHFDRFAKEYWEFRSIEFFGDYLLIACGAKGLGVFPVQKTNFTISLIEVTL